MKKPRQIWNTMPLWLKALISPVIILVGGPLAVVFFLILGPISLIDSIINDDTDG